MAKTRRPATSVGRFSRDNIPTETHLPSRPEKADPAFIADGQSDLITEMQIKALLAQSESDQDLSSFLGNLLPISLVLHLLGIRKQVKKPLQSHLILP